MKVILLLFLMLTVGSGCSLNEIKRDFLGITYDYVKGAEKKYTMILDKDISYCFDKIEESLKRMQAKVYQMDKKRNFIIAYKFNKVFKCIDTTEVGVLMTPLEQNKTQIDIYSRNHELAEFVLAELFKEPEQKPSE